MISGPEIRRLALLFVLASVPSVPALGAPQPAWGLAQLMHALAQVRTSSARFTERDTAPVLSAPLISTGTLTYKAPDYLRKITLSPVPERFVLENNRVTLTTNGQVHVFALRQAPQIAGLVEGIQGTLAGNLSELQQFYTLSLTGSAAAWRLRLLPRADSLRRLVRGLVIRGSGSQINIIDTASPDGSDSLMHIQPDAP